MRRKNRFLVKEYVTGEVVFVAALNSDETFDNTPVGVYSNFIYFYIWRRMDQSKKKLIRRLKIIEGQVRGLQVMLERDAYCIDVITQTSAVKQGLTVIEDALMEGHLGSCLVRQIKSGKEEKAKEEILKVYRLKRR